MTDSCPVGHHVRLRLLDDDVIADSPARRRRVARTVLERWTTLGLLAFRGRGPRLDLLATCPAEAAMEAARLSEMTLVKRLGLRVGFARARVDAARGQWHMTNIFRLILRGNGAAGEDPFHEASNLPDLLGLRVLGRETAWHVRRRLPRIKRHELLGYLGMPELHDRTMSLDWLLESTVAAAGLPDVTGKSRETVAAVVAMLAVARAVLTSSQLAAMTGRSLSTVRRLLRVEADPDLVRAIRQQMHLHSFKGGAARRISSPRPAAGAPTGRAGSAPG